MSEPQVVPKVALGGKEFAVPPFRFRDLVKYLPKLRRVGQIDFTKIEEPDLMLLGDVMFDAINRPDPDGGTAPSLTREQFDDLPITLKQIIAAIPAVLVQAGAEPVKAGEAQAESPSASTS